MYSRVQINCTHIPSKYYKVKASTRGKLLLDIYSLTLRLHIFYKGFSYFRRVSAIFYET